MRSARLVESQGDGLGENKNISARFVVPTVAASTDLVVHLGLDAHGVRRVNEIVAVPGRVEYDIIETEPTLSAPVSGWSEPPGCRVVWTATSGPASVSACC